MNTNETNEEYSDEEYYNEDDELLEESQGKSQYVLLFIGLGILFAAAVAGAFYFFLKDKKAPVQIEKIDNVYVDHKKFKKDFILEKVKETLPLLPAGIVKKLEVKPRVFKSKIIKGGGGKLDISQKIQEPVKKKVVKKEEPVKAKKAAYRGGISTVAGVHQYNQNLSLARGTLIPCNLDTRLISMVAGQLSCTVAEDVYSVNGNVLLIEKGSTAMGSYKSTAISNGMNRMYAMWDDIRTPNNVIISVGSGSSDELGSAGMVGEIDNHWMERLGGAILISLIDDGLSMLSQKYNNAQGYIINSSRNNAKTMSQTVLEQYINIPPTLYKNHGDLINIYVNKDIDFSEVYGLER